MTATRPLSLSTIHRAIPDWVDATMCNCKPDPIWTAETRPNPHVLAHLREICSSCPVQRLCAAHALATNAEAGMWAGVWLPSRQHAGGRKIGLRWLEARRILAAVAWRPQSERQRQTLRRKERRDRGR